MKKKSTGLGYYCALWGLIIRSFESLAAAPAFDSNWHTYHGGVFQCWRYDMGILIFQNTLVVNWTRVISIVSPAIKSGWDLRVLLGPSKKKCQWARIKWLAYRFCCHRNIQGFQSTLLQFRQPLKNVIQVLHIGHNHWIFVLSVNCQEGEMKVHDSFYYSIDKHTYEIILHLIPGVSTITLIKGLICHCSECILLYQ